MSNFAKGEPIWYVEPYCLMIRISVGSCAEDQVGDMVKLKIKDRRNLFARPSNLFRSERDAYAGAIEAFNKMIASIEERRARYERKLEATK